jgi:proteasome accessory factor A
MPQLRDSSSKVPSTDGISDPDYDSFDRIFGLETEYGLATTGTTQHCEVSETAMAMFRPVVSRARSTNTYLDNGSRLYLDVGSHPEYATAEARDPLDTLRQDLAGEMIMGNLAACAQRELRGTYGDSTTVHLFKNNADSSDHSFGCHENYLVRRYVGLPAIETQLLPFLITRQLFTGAGCVRPNGFEITQRARFLEDGVSSATTRVRPMVNTRDEPHADPDKFRRLHVIIGDSNRSQWATLMKLATTHLVLCVIEEAARTGRPSGLETCALRNPASANLALSTDLTLDDSNMDLVDAESFFATEDLPGNVSPRTMQNFNASTISTRQAPTQGATALEIQYRYWSVVSSFVNDHREAIQRSLSQSSCENVLAEWKAALDALNTRNFNALRSKVDWIAKRELLTQLTDRDPDVPYARLKQLDMDYHDINAGVTYPSLYRHDLAVRLVSEEQVLSAMKCPPNDTRAALRGAFVTAATGRGAQFICDWTSLKTNTPQHLEAQLIDPFSAEPTAEYRTLMSSLSDQSENRPLLSVLNRGQSS